jgi:hypothetical protein
LAAAGWSAPSCGHAAHALQHDPIKVESNRDLAFIFNALEAKFDSLSKALRKT